MSDQRPITEFVDEEPASRRDTEPGQPEGQQILFRFTNDQFVNEGIAELARELQAAERFDVEVTATTVGIPVDQSPTPVLEMIEDVIRDALTQTHVRTAAAREINTRLNELGVPQQDERFVPPPDRHFPGRVEDGLTIYDGDSVTEDEIAAVGLVPEEIPAVESGKRGLYALNPEFVGNSSSKHFPESQVPRFERYFETFAATLRNEVEPDATVCMNCGSEEMPAYKDVNDETLEYNQTFTVLASASGRATALGYRSRDTAHKGRCVACLVAGFYYSVMDKIIRPTGTSDNDVRVFTPVGNLEELLNIRRDLQDLYQDIDPRTTEDYRGRQTIGDLFTTAHGMQVIEFYEQVLRHLNTVTEATGEGLFQRERRHRPTALTTYISKVGQTRTIRAMETIDPKSWAYEAVSQRTFGTDGEEYWPVADVLSWFTQLRVGDDNRHTTIQNDLAFGILTQNVERIERAVFETTKLLDRSDAGAPYVPHQGYRGEYFQYIMTESTTLPDRIDDEAIDSIRKVATSLGRVFHGQDDIGVLIKLQNASTPNTFLQAFEKAAMQAQKRSHEEPPGRFEASRDDDVSQVLKLVGDRETFEPAKRMFVIHASLAAQYENVQDDYDGAPAENESSTAATTSSDSE